MQWLLCIFFSFKFMVRVLRIGKALFLQGIILLAGLKWVLNWPIPKPHGPGVVLTKTAIILATELQVMFRQMCWKKGFKTLPTKNTQGKTFWIDKFFSSNFCYRILCHHRGLQQTSHGLHLEHKDKKCTSIRQ